MVTAVNRTLGAKSPSNQDLGVNSTDSFSMQLDLPIREAFEERYPSPMPQASSRRSGSAAGPTGGFSPAARERAMDVRLSPRADSLDAGSLRLAVAAAKATTPTPMSGNTGVRPASQDAQRQMSFSSASKLNEPAAFLGGSISMEVATQARRGPSPAKDMRDRSAASPPAQPMSPLPGGSATYPRGSVGLQTANSYQPSASPYAKTRQPSTQRQVSTQNSFANEAQRQTSAQRSSLGSTYGKPGSFAARSGSPEHPLVRPTPSSRMVMPTSSPKSMPATPAFRPN